MTSRLSKSCQMATQASGLQARKDELDQLSTAGVDVAEQVILSGG